MARPSSRTPVEFVEISPAGALAGRTFSLLLVGSALAVIGMSWDELWRTCGAVEGRCVERAAGAGLLTILSVIAAAIGVAVWIRVRRRPLDREGSSRYVWALGVVFALGMILGATRVPAFTCERGRFDDALELCMHPPSTSEPSRWLLVKQVLVLVGLIGGVALAATPRHTRFWAILSTVAWVGGAGWLLLDTLVRA
jgi:uncharacterized membrane protein YidH (DUF202 family)